jgi:hypothetical protein
LPPVEDSALIDPAADGIGDSPMTDDYKDVITKAHEYFHSGFN